MYKLQIYESLKKDVINIFENFCEKYKEIIPKPFNEYSCCAQLIENLRNDYFKFYQEEDYQLSFLYPHELFKNQKGLLNSRDKICFLCVNLFMEFFIPVHIRRFIINTCADITWH